MNSNHQAILNRFITRSMAIGAFAAVAPIAAAQDSHSGELVDDHGHVHVSDPSAPPITLLTPTTDNIEALTNAWGPCGESCPWDLNGDRVVDGADMTILLTSNGRAGLDDGIDPGQDPLVPHNEAEPHLWTWTCPVETGPGQIIIQGNPLAGGSGGGMAGNGWDGAGLGAATIYWVQENPISGDISAAAQRAALIDGMNRWSSVVQITWYEAILPNRTVQVDWLWTAGEHSAVEPQEAGDPDCAFGGGTLAHAGFPPGVNSACVNPMAESWSGNVHFNTAFTWEQNTEGPAGAFSTALIAAHEVGHSIGLTHSSSPDIMRPSFGNTDAAQAPSANDILNVRAGYATGVGSMRTVEGWGIWVDNAFAGTQRGTSGNPVTSVWTAIDNFPPGAGATVIHIDSGTYNESGGRTITRAMTLRAENGTVVIE